MNILVTGGAGFIGSHLVDKLIYNKHRVTVVDDLSNGSKVNLNPQAKFYKLKIQSPRLSQVFNKQKFHIVYHLAAQINVRKSIQDPIFDAQTNILGSINLFENCTKYKVKKIIFISSGGAIYGDGVKIPTPETAQQAPISPYGITKLSLEKYLHYYSLQYKLPYTILRLANIYGPRQDSTGEGGVVAIFCRQLINQKPLYINGNGRQTRDFVYVADVVNACLKSLSNKVQGIYNIGTARQTNINQLAKKLIDISHTKINIKHRPAIKGEQQLSCLSYTKIKNQLNWQPEYNLTQGLKATWQWFQDN